MKHKALLGLLISSVIMSSCSSYYQIATLSSNNVKMSNDGDYAYSLGQVTIHYNFWSSCGNVSFIIDNQSDEDIQLDLSQSFFINNGFASDYFQNRKTIYSTGSSASTGRMYSSSKTTAASASKGVEVGAVRYSNGAAVGASIGYSASGGVATNSTGSISSSVSTMSSKTIEYQEMPIAIIPAHSAKSFGEFSVTFGEYKKCGFIRNPKWGEDAVIRCNENDSPYIVENRLVFVVNGNEYSVVNSFYVSELQNLSEKDVIKTEPYKNCAGRTVSGAPALKTNIYKASNRYYVKYTIANSNEDKGRTR